MGLENVSNSSAHEEKPADVEELLREGNNVSIKVRGYSMYPFLIPGKDSVIVEPAAGMDAFKRGEVLLYRRATGLLVLHRVWKVKNDGLYFVGDNQMEIEGPLDRKQVIGKMVSFEKNGRYHDVSWAPYYISSRVWLFLRPLRGSISRFIHKLKS